MRIVRHRQPYNADALVPLAARTSESRRSCSGRTLWAVGLAGGGVTFKGQRREPRNAESSSRSRPARALRPLGRRAGLVARRERAREKRLRDFTTERVSVSLNQPDKGGCSPRCLLAGWLSAATRSHVSELESRQSHPRGGQLDSGMVGSFYTVLRAGGDSLLALRSAQ